MFAVCVVWFTFLPRRWYFTLLLWHIAVDVFIRLYFSLYIFLYFFYDCWTKDCVAALCFATESFSHTHCIARHALICTKHGTEVVYEVLYLNQEVVLIDRCKDTSVTSFKWLEHLHQRKNKSMCRMAAGINNLLTLSVLWLYLMNHNGNLCLKMSILLQTHLVLISLPYWRCPCTREFTLAWLMLSLIPHLSPLPEPEHSTCWQQAGLPDLKSISQLLHLGRKPPPRLNGPLRLNEAL